MLSGGIAYATIPTGGVINGCYSRGDGSLRVIDSGMSSCRPIETALSWNVQGAAGPQGPVGPAGPRGPSGPAIAVSTSPAIDASSVAGSTDQGFHIAPPGGGGPTFLGLELQPGRYFITARIELRNRAAPFIGDDHRQVSCYLWAGGLIDAVAPNIQGHLTGSEITLEGVTRDLPDPTEASVNCQQVNGDDGDVVGAVPTMTALKVA